MIIYIHGFKSAGNGAKLDELKKLFPIPFFNENEIISPTLSANPKEAIAELKDLINAGTVLIGTSLGGFYAAVLAATNPKIGKTLIINPVVNPAEKMKAYLGENENYKTGEKFDWTEEHLAELNALSETMGGGNIDWDWTKIAIGTNDDKTDPGLVKEWYGCPEVHMYEDDHRFRSAFPEAVSDHLL